MSLTLQILVHIAFNYISSENKKNLQMKFLFQKRHNILIAGNNIEISEWLAHILSAKYKCIAVADLKNASEIIERQNLSLIIADISNFKSGGYEICEKIKSNINTCHIPFIILSENNRIEQMIKGYEMGADDYITKPFNRNLLSAKINRLIQNRLMIKEKYRVQNFISDPEKNSIPKDDHFLKVVKKILNENLSNPDLNVTSLSEKLNVSTTQLYRNIKKSTGSTPVEFIRRVRLQSAFKMLNQDNDSVTEVCYNTGFNNVSYFIKCFKNMFGVTPAHFRNKTRYELHDGLIS